jgi:D-alanyl-lipoteichoic acid acyltransferase DltB (MBOAT superfamily)
MLFPTVDFAVFFVIVFTLSWLLRPVPTVWRVFMISASLIFYSWWYLFPGDGDTLSFDKWWYVLLLPGSAAFNWIMGQFIFRAMGPHGQKTSTSRAMVAAAVVGNLGLLTYFKYTGFLFDSLSGIVSASPWELADDPAFIESILLPIGISFFTFCALSYVIDMGRGEIKPMPFLDFFLYLSFFPHLVAGPIVRASEFAPQLRDHADPRHLQYAEAFRLIFAGLFKKVVISGYLASQIVDPVFDNPGLESSANLLFAIYGYAIQIYADFSGYTDIAIGVALLLGIRFPQNFNAPYIARSLQDFWRRWHMTLSRWLRDYLYIPLGGNRGSDAFIYRNLMLTMVIGGLWHGAAWTFVIWGAIHGLALVSERAEQAWRPAVAVGLADLVMLGLFSALGWSLTFPGVVFIGVVVALLTNASGRLEALENPTPAGTVAKIARWAITFNVVCLAWVFFRAPNLSEALTILQRLFTAGGTGTLVTAMVMVVIGGSIASQFVPETWVDRVQVVYSRMGFALQLVALVLGLLLIDSLGPEGIDPFIYFQF